MIVRGKVVLVQSNPRAFVVQPADGPPVSFTADIDDADFAAAATACAAVPQPDVEVGDDTPPSCGGVSILP